jgi:hypothetical protein
LRGLFNGIGDGDNACIRIAADRPGVNFADAAGAEKAETYAHADPLRK